MQVYNGKIFNVFRELENLGFKFRKIDDNKYKVWFCLRDWDKREFVFETLDELQAFVEGLMLGVALEFETELKLKKDEILKTIKMLLSIMNETI